MNVIDVMFVTELGANAVMINSVEELDKYEMDDDCREEITELIGDLDEGETICFDKRDPDTYRILNSD